MNQRLEPPDAASTLGSLANRFLSQSDSLWYSWIFGSGTKLYVTGKQEVKPVVSLYPAVSSAHLEGRSLLLCLSSAMFPPLVQFSWKRQKTSGPVEEMSPGQGEQLELRETGHTAAILLIRQQEKCEYSYHCHVQHQSGTVVVQTPQGDEGSFAAHCPSETQPTEQPTDTSLPSQYQVWFLCLLYSVLIVKGLVYCCGLSLMMVRGEPSSAGCSPAP
ncbi:immunoglobulin lambda-like polypeptide 5 [Aulostomus maculatus]